MSFDAKRHTIALHFKGSQAYGLATQASDIDLGGVFIPPAPYVLGFVHRIEQVENVQPFAEEFKDRIAGGKKVEGTIYALPKMLRLCADCNPNMIEILWVEEEDFLALDEERVRKAAMEKIGFDENLSSLIEREARYRNALRHHQQYLDWKKSRNAERAALEAKSGYDTKHASHVVRLLRMGEEILSSGRVIVKRRDDREELLAIRRGAWTYDRLMEYAEGMQGKLEELYKTSTLQRGPDIDRIDRLCIDLMAEALASGPGA